MKTTKFSQVRISWNDALARDMTGWSKWQNSITGISTSGRTEGCHISLREDITVLTADCWCDVKDISDNCQGVVAALHDGRVLAEGSWEDPLFSDGSDGCG